MSDSGLAFKWNDANQSNLYVMSFKAAMLEDGRWDRVRATCEGTGEPIFILGETFGKKVQDLHYGQQGRAFRVFDVYVGEPRKGRYLDYDELLARVKGEWGLDTTPRLYRGPFSMEIAERHRDGKTTFRGGHVREGIVIAPVKERGVSGASGEPRETEVRLPEVPAATRERDGLQLRGVRDGSPIRLRPDHGRPPVGATGDLRSGHVTPAQGCGVPFRHAPTHPHTMLPPPPFLTDFLAPQRLRATQFLKQMSSGRTQPWLVVAQTEDGNEYDVVVKLQGSLQLAPLQRRQPARAFLGRLRLCFKTVTPHLFRILGRCRALVTNHVIQEFSGAVTRAPPRATEPAPVREGGARALVPGPRPAPPSRLPPRRRSAVDSDPVTQFRSCSPTMSRTGTPASVSSEVSPEVRPGIARIAATRPGIASAA